MKLNGATQLLFGGFPREVADPRRRLVYGSGQFEKFVEQRDGVTDCYTSLYSQDGAIDKVFWDFDDPKGIIGCREDAERLYTWLLAKDFNVIPVLSGKKGFHIYLLLKPKWYKNGKELLTKATYSIMCDAFGYDDDTGKIETAKADPHIIGDVRRITRIPNTLRPPENMTWCTYLPEDWVKMSTAELVNHMKSPHSYDYDLSGHYPTLDEFPEPPVEITRWEPQGGVTPIFPIKGNIFLKNLLRPCLYRNMMSDHPGHAARVASTVDLLDFFSPEEIYEMYRTLGWGDWDPEVTLMQIESCKGLKPYGCKKLRSLGVPEVCCVC